MESNDYRLERWLAIILSLLFFLPFVARADEIVYPDLYVDEVPYKDGDAYLAIAQNALVPVKIRVERLEADEHDLHSGTSVEVVGFEDAWLIRGTNLHPGPITLASRGFFDLVPGETQTTITLGPTKYELSYRCTKAQCTLVLSSSGVAQDLATISTNHGIGEEPEHRVLFAGDLDRDGRLDLIANHTDNAWDWYPTLWLSSAAKKGALVGKTAELVGTVGGC